VVGRLFEYPGLFQRDSTSNGSQDSTTDSKRDDHQYNFHVGQCDKDVVVAEANKKFQPTTILRAEGCEFRIVPSDDDL